MKGKLGQGLKKLGGNALVRGILKEAVSYIPVVGDNLANTIENKLGTGVATEDPQSQKILIIAGRVLVGGLVISLIAGWIDRETFSFILGEIE